MKEFFFLQIFCFSFITQYFICANLIQKLFDIQYNRSQRSLRMKNDHINLINLKIDFLNPNDFRFAIRWWFDHYGNGDALPIRYVCWAITWVCQRMLYHYMSHSYVCCTIIWVCPTYVVPLHESVNVCCTITWVCPTYVVPLHESVNVCCTITWVTPTYVVPLLNLSMTLSFIFRCIKPLLYFFVPIHQSITKRANCGNSDNGEVMLVISTDITENVNNDGTCSNKCSNCSKINVLRHLWTHPPLFLSSSTRRRQRLVSSTGSFVSTVLPRFDMIWYDMLSCCWNMIWRAILYCSELCWTVLYSSVLRCAVLFSVLFCSLLYCTY